MVNKNPLLNLHPELQLYIIDRLENLKDLGALAQTCKALHQQLSPVLYRIAHRTDPDILPWLCAEGGCNRAGSVARFLSSGADPAFMQYMHKHRSASGLLEHPGAEKLDTHRFFEKAMDSRQWDRSIRASVKPPRKAWTELGLRPTLSLPGYSSTEELCKAIDKSKVSDGFNLQWSPIHLATVKGHVDVLKVLLDYDSNKNNTLIDSLAAGYCKVDEDPYFIASRTADRLIRGNLYQRTRKQTVPQSELWKLHTPLRAALCNRQQETARLLIERGANLEFTGPQGQKEHALHVAARHGCTKIIRYLLTTRKDLQIDINVAYDDGWTALCEAITSPDSIAPSPASAGSDALKCLLDLGADVNHSLGGDDNFTYLHLACFWRQWSRALVLLEAGADVNAVFTREGTGQFPLRAIEMVCMETWSTTSPAERQLERMLIAEEDRPKPVSDERMDLLKRMLRDYKADTGICPGGSAVRWDGRPTPSPLAVAASNPTAAGALALVFFESGVDFQWDTRLILDVMNFGHEHLIHSAAAGLQAESEMMVVLRMLVRYGAQVPRDKEGTRLLARGVHHLIRYASHPWKAPLIPLVAPLVGKLCSRAGMDPNSLAWKPHRENVPPTRAQLDEMAELDDYDDHDSEGVWDDGDDGEGEFDTERTLFRNILCHPNYGINLEVGAALWRAGATPPSTMGFLKDWVGMLPRLTVFEVQMDNYYRRQGFRQEEDLTPDGSGTNVRSLPSNEEARLAIFRTGPTMGAANGRAGDDDSGRDEEDSIGDEDESDLVDDDLNDDLDEDDDDDDDIMDSDHTEEEHFSKEGERYLSESESLRSILVRTLAYIGQEKTKNDVTSHEDIYRELFKTMSIKTADGIDANSGCISVDEDELEKWRREGSLEVSKWLNLYVEDRDSIWDYKGADKILRICRRIRSTVVKSSADAGLSQRQA